jgi:hypothetical protein
MKCISPIHWHTSDERPASYYWLHPTDLSYLSDVSRAGYHTCTGYVFSYYEVKCTSCRGKAHVIKIQLIIKTEQILEQQFTVYFAVFCTVTPCILVDG